MPFETLQQMAQHAGSEELKTSITHLFMGS
jgi:hypothetical protein